MLFANLVFFVALRSLFCHSCIMALNDTILRSLLCHSCIMALNDKILRSLLCHSCIMALTDTILRSLLCHSCIMALNDTILEFQGNLPVLNCHLCNFKLENVPSRKYLWIYSSAPIIVTSGCLWPSATVKSRVPRFF
jgi:hypothetical protein